MALDARFDKTWMNPSWWNLLVMLPWTIGLMYAISEFRTDRDIAKRQETCQGVITAHEPQNHNRYGFTFSVNGKSYYGWESPRKQELAIGEQVLVYYDPQKPNTNALTKYSELSLDALGPVPMLLFGIGGVALFISIRRRRNRKIGSLPI